VNELVVVSLACVILSLFLACVWVLDSTSRTWLRAEAKRRHWAFEEESDGLQLKLTGNADGIPWSARWDARGLVPRFEMRIEGQDQVDGWLFVARRDGGPAAPNFISSMLTGREQPAWVMAWNQARAISSGEPVLDRSYVLSASTPPAGANFFLIPLLQRLESLPEAIGRRLLVIRGNREMLFWLEEAERSNAVALVEALLPVARELPVNR